MPTERLALPRRLLTLSLAALLPPPYPAALGLTGLAKSMTFSEKTGFDDVT
jgi:hypothetical protein